MNRVIYFNIVAKFLLIVSAFNHFFSYVFDKDIFKYFIHNKFILMIIGYIIGLVGIYFFLNRDFYLPFLGPTYIPFPLAKNEKLQGKVVNIKLNNLPPNTKVIYWAANPSKQIIKDPRDAYKGFNSSGVVITNKDGSVSFDIICPAQYSVNKLPFFVEKVLQQHVHYRYEKPEYPGMFSKVYTKWFNC